MTLIGEVPQTRTTGGDADAAPPELTEWGARLDQAVSRIQELPDEQRLVAEEYALALDALARSALTTMVRTLRADERGKQLLFELVDDPGVRLLLGMHGIIRMPDPEQAGRVSRGIGEDGSTAPSPHGGSKGAFFSLESMFRGPQQAEGHACGCGGAGGDACGCGDH